MGNSETHNLPLAIFLMILATIAYSLMALLVKVALPHTPITILLFFRFLILFLLVLPFVISKDFDFIKTKNFKLHLLRAVAAVIAITLTFKSITLIPVSTVVLLSSTEPLFIPFIFRIAKGTPIIASLYWGIGIGTIGIALVLHPTHGFFHYASLLALAAGLCRAISVSTTRTLSKGEATRTIMFYFFFLGTIFTGLSTINSWHDTASWPWALIIGVGVSSFFFQLFLTKALRHAPARLITPFSYLSVVFTALADWLLWNQGLTWLAIIGMILVIGGAILTVVIGKGRMQARNSA